MYNSKKEQNYLNKCCNSCGKLLYIIDSISCSECAIKNDKRLIKEFLNDFTWYMAFELHYKWFQWKRCICKITPFQFRDWMLKKYQKGLK